MLAGQCEHGVAEARLHVHDESIISFQRVVLYSKICALRRASVAGDEQTRSNSAVRMQTTGAHNNLFRAFRDVVDARLQQ